MLEPADIRYDIQREAESSTTNGANVNIPIYL